MWPILISLLRNLIILTIFLYLAYLRYYSTPNPRFLRPRSLRFRFLRTRHYLMKVSKVQCPNHYITITLIFAPSIFALPIFGGPNVRKNRGFGVFRYLGSLSINAHVLTMYV